MRDRSEDQELWRSQDEERRSEGRMRYDYGRDDQSQRGSGRQEEYGSRREEGHSRWQGGEWQGEYPGREELRRGGGGEREEYRGSSRGEQDRSSERWREQGSGWSGSSERGRGEISGGRQEQGRWGIGSERSGEGRMSWEDRGDRHRSTDSGEFRGYTSGERGRYQERAGEMERGREDYWTRGGGRSEGSPGRREEYQYRSGLGSSDQGSSSYRSSERGDQGSSSYRSSERGDQGSSSYGSSSRGSEYGSSGYGSPEYRSSSSSRSEGSRGDRSRGDQSRGDQSRGDQSRDESSRRDISGTWRQFDSWGDTSYGDSRGQGLGHHRRDSYTSDFWSQGERGDDRDR